MRYHCAIKVIAIQKVLKRLNGSFLGVFAIASSRAIVQMPSPTNSICEHSYIATGMREGRSFFEAMLYSKMRLLSSHELLILEFAKIVFVVVLFATLNCCILAGCGWLFLRSALLW